MAATIVNAKPRLLYESGALVCLFLRFPHQTPRFIFGKRRRVPIGETNERLAVKAKVQMVAVGCLTIVEQNGFRRCVQFGERHIRQVVVEMPLFAFGSGDEEERFCVEVRLQSTFSRRVAESESLLVILHELKYPQCKMLQLIARLLLWILLDWLKQGKQTWVVRCYRCHEFKRWRLIERLGENVFDWRWHDAPISLEAAKRW